MSFANAGAGRIGSERDFRPAASDFRPTRSARAREARAGRHRWPRRLVSILHLAHSQSVELRNGTGSRN
ncbi:hypothetical protein Ani05nite_63760 [Amorphoplanes nipponensis]|uniref:Uncharacterized protein n=1 Tax=Actinoplanes nipponensis TaxID=135950 RepID=A0A919JP63_9ACTN|nr:hypothetical protein Ani05nite_63760 [Actinoplanes nipponensis]